MFDPALLFQSQTSVNQPVSPSAPRHKNLVAAAFLPNPPPFDKGFSPEHGLSLDESLVDFMNHAEDTKGKQNFIDFGIKNGLNWEQTLEVADQMERMKHDPVPPRAQEAESASTTANPEFGRWAMGIARIEHTPDPTVPHTADPQAYVEAQYKAAKAQAQEDQSALERLFNDEGLTPEQRANALGVYHQVAQIATREEPPRWFVNRELARRKLLAILGNQSSGGEK